MSVLSFYIRCTYTVRMRIRVRIARGASICSRDNVLTLQVFFAMLTVQKVAYIIQKGSTFQRVEQSLHLKLINFTPSHESYLDERKQKNNLKVFIKYAHL